MTTPEKQIAVVTGAGRGIGRSTAERLAHDGMDVAVLDLDLVAAEETADLVRAAGRAARAYAVDVADRTQVGAAFASITEDLGTPTALVNNAGVTRDNLLFKMSDDDWRTVIRVHLEGHFVVSQCAQAVMVEAGYGRIVNISSVSALGNRGQANYATAKAGIQGFTKTLALELGRYGITANCVAPGFVVSDMTRATAERIGQDWESYLSDRVSAIPVGRAGHPEDIAHTVSFFCQPASGYVTGQVLYVAGGPKA
ncbi:3-oxoacyl-ACP reductase FabG [Nocardioides humi]|uniref:3-oxoacyl-ACP reductase FabG n=1 Tax=Nocardioides humi TaxID=449461 RepID=A0ABN2B2E2_9ACTN